MTFCLRKKFSCHDSAPRYIHLDDQTFFVCNFCFVVILAHSLTSLYGWFVSVLNSFAGLQKQNS